ncbi:MAG: HTTM domain-containing protein [Candidatus Omnitrophica bacterium]|nr:HTTM domain-containing protein [Candidatus Omnitrophota bacterium]
MNKQNDYKSNKITEWKKKLARPTNPVSLACFRIGFGIFMFFHIYLYQTPDVINAVYLSPDFHFTFPLFDWLHLPIPTAVSISILLKIIAVSALCIAIGLLTRISAGIFFITFGYIFLLEKSEYSQYYYLVLLLSFLFMITNANRFFSVDNLIFKQSKKNAIPYWNLFLFQFQFILVYFFGGIAYLNNDWISGRVVQSIFEGAGDLFFFATSISALLILLSAPLMLIYKPLKYAGILLLVIFNAFIKYSLGFGIFPYLMIISSVLFIHLEEIRGLSRLFRPKKAAATIQPEMAHSEAIKPGVWLFIITYVFFQFFIPLRFLLEKGPVQWTLNGSRFSWRLLAQNNLGHIDFFVTDIVTGETKEAPRLKGITVSSYLQMACHPDMIIQYARYLHDVYQKQGVYNPIITSNSFVSFNGRPFSLFINPEFNLAHPTIHPNSDNLLTPAPFVRQDTMITPKNVGRFFPPEYQLAVIEEESLLPGDHPTVGVMNDLIYQLIGDPTVSPAEISDTVVELHNMLYSKYGRHFTIKQILETLYDKAGQMTTVPSIDELIKYFL